MLFRSDGEQLALPSALADNTGRYAEGVFTDLGLWKQTVMDSVSAILDAAIAQMPST